MFTITNPTLTHQPGRPQIAASLRCVGVSSAILTMRQIHASYHAQRAVEEVRDPSLGWVPYALCVGLPYHGPTPDNRPCPACTLDSEEWRARNEAGTLPTCTCLPSVADEEDPAYEFYCIQREVEDELEQIAGRQRCPDCGTFRMESKPVCTLGHRGHPGAEYSTYYRCPCGHEDL